MLRIVLVHPEIPANTGNIARLCVCNDLELHLVHPLGFQITDRNLRRAGMDYWKHLRLVEHDTLDGWIGSLGPDDRVNYFSSKGEGSLWDASFAPRDWLVFGSESKGLPERLAARVPGEWLRIPMRGEFVRCLNLSSAVAAATYEAMRQCEHVG